MGVNRPAKGRALPQLLATGGVLAVGLVTAVFLQQNHRLSGVKAPAAPATSSPSPIAVPAVPTADLAAANLSTAARYVTPLRMLANDGTGKTLIGAYADTARTVLFMRAATSAGGQTPGASSTISIYDSHGFLNGATGGARAPGGDSIVSLDLGPRPDKDGLAHLTVTNAPPQEPLTAPPPTTGWAYRFALKPAPAIALSAPSTFRLGTWTVNVEDLSVTPSVIDFQAVVAGATNEQLYSDMRAEPVRLLDAVGSDVRMISANAGVTVPKQQLNPTTYRNTRVHYQWPRPANATTYTLRVAGNGTTQLITLKIPPL